MFYTFLKGFLELINLVKVSSSLKIVNIKELSLLRVKGSNRLVGKRVTKYTINKYNNNDNSLLLLQHYTIRLTKP